VTLIEFEDHLLFETVLILITHTINEVLFNYDMSTHT